MKTASLIFRALIVFAVLSAFLLSGRTPIASPAEAQTNKRIQKSQRREQTSKWPSKSERWALIIGVDKYPYSQQLRMLKGAAKDAEDLKNALIRHANFQEDRVILMTNEQPENLQPTLGNIFQQLSRLKNASKDGLLLVSFAGHGIQYERRAFLVPTDARDDHDWALLARTSIDVTDMKEWILDTGVRQVVIILDACRNNPPGRGNTDNSQAKAYARGLNLDARNREVEAFALLYATTEGGLAFEDSKEQRGHFTRAVIEALSGGAANEKGEVTLGGLVKYVQEEVPKRAKRQGEQKPDYEMRGYKADELVIAIASPPPTPVTLPESKTGKVSLTKSPQPPMLKPTDFPISTALTSLPAPPRAETPVVPPETKPQVKTPVRLPQTKAERLTAVRLLPPPMTAILTVPTTNSEASPLPPPSAVVPLLPVNFEAAEVDARGMVKDRRKGQALGFSVDLSHGIKLEMIKIPDGSFTMGSQQSELGSTANERPQHHVSIQSFAMSKHEVTQEQWRAVASLPKVRIDLNPHPSYFKGDKLPVEQVSWEEAEEFCERLSRKTKLTYRLPSEAEWEYACRARTSTPFHFGETITIDLVNYDGNFPYKSAPKGRYRQRTTPAGSLPAANAFGLLDMHGNVMEWIADVWHDSYDGAPEDQKKWDEGGDARYRVVRGGNWFNKATISRTAYRDHFSPDHRAYTIGFRVVVEK